MNDPNTNNLLQHLTYVVHQRETLKERIRELEVLLREAHGILTEAMLDKEHSVWMEQVDKALIAHIDDHVFYRSN